MTIAPPRGKDTAVHIVQLSPPAEAKVWIGQGRPHETMAVPTVLLEPGDVLVEVELATICGSDVHTVTGHRSAPTPLVLGHEYVGRVVNIAGEARAVDGARLAVGERVVWSIMASCGVCDRCRKGLPQKCRDLLKYGHERLADRWELSGGFATHVHVRAGSAIARVGETLPAAVLAPAACGTATALAAVERAAEIVDLEGAVAVISGAGLIGLSAAAMLAERDARVIVADPDPKRRETALEFGAHAAIDPTREGALDTAVTRLGATDIDVVVEASGSSHAVASALANIGVGGVVVLVGSVFPSPGVTLDPEAIVRGLITVRGVHNYAPRDLLAAVGFLQRKADRYPFAALVDQTYPLSELEAAIVAAQSGASVRVGVVPGQ